ncbi:MAG: glutamate--cysteine ligase, partial [Pseudomonadota bacterium]
ARQVVDIADAGLKARARPGSGGLIPDETHFLNALKESIATGQCPADELLDDYNGPWGGDLSQIYAAYSY